MANEIPDDLKMTASALRPSSPQPHLQAMEELVIAVQKLSMARSLNEITAIVRHAARTLTGADGASFVLRDNGFCYYADEEAIAPLWKGKRFPMEICISGWVMLNRMPVIIPNIYEDSRIPTEAYRPTFVKSLAMVPIRSLDPVGAIGTYWANPRQPTTAELKVLQALANSTSVAMENVQLYQSLEQKVAERTARLQMLNEELDSFSHSVSHDLRAPLRHICGFIDLLQDKGSGELTATGRRYLKIVQDSATNMNQLIEDLLAFSRHGRVELQKARVDMNALAAEAWDGLKAERKERKFVWRLSDLPPATGDHSMLKQVWVNLLSNAVKYTRGRDTAEVTVTGQAKNGEIEFSVKDNGAGFDMKYADKLFGVFQRLHSVQEFEGTGIGLALVRRIITRHNGRIWAASEVNQGTTFHFALPAA